MSQIYCYMFEAKSIQKYIFRTGKLRDVIATSERLDQLIDTNDNSVLSKILVHFKSKGSKKLNFIRRKGGAFYVYSECKEILKSLRKIWTLTVQQLFPQMDFIDGIASGDNLVTAMNKTHEKLAESRNNPAIKMPLFRTNMKLAARTANPSVPFSSILKHTDKIIDTDTNINRHTYQLMKQDNYEQFLYKKFINQNNLDQILADTNNNPSNIFPLDLNPEDKITENSKDSNNKFPYIENNHDLALIHIDGNGIGILLKKLKDQLKDAKQEHYKDIFRGFSDVLCRSTEAAAKFATEELIKKVATENLSNLPMRPLVMGGDDITLLCRSDLALSYARDFCLQFQSITRKELKKLYKKYKKLNIKKLPDCLTASGGIVFQKATQPFTSAHHLVEELCNQAKIISKDNTTDGKKDSTGAPALAFMRIATIQDDNYKRLFEEGYQIKDGDKILSTAIGKYIVDKTEKTYEHPKLDDLMALVEIVTHKDSPLLLSLFRKVLTQLHRGNLYEAQQLINRAEVISKTSSTDIKDRFKAIKGKNTGEWWLWNENGNNNQQTILADITTLAKFKGGKSND